MSQEEKFLACLEKVAGKKENLSFLELLGFAFTLFCCLDNYVQNTKIKDEKIKKLLQRS